MTEQDKKARTERYERMTLVIAHGITLMAVVGLLLFQVIERDRSAQAAEARLDVTMERIDELHEYFDGIVVQGRENREDQTQEILSRLDRLLEEHMDEISGD